MVTWRQWILLAVLTASSCMAVANDGKDNVCLACHSTTHTPIDGTHAATLSCQSCHGPSEAHIAPGPDGIRAPTELRGNDSCLSCHASEAGPHFAVSAHQPEEVGCNGCHRAHEPDPMLGEADLQVAACLSCHRDVRAEFARRSSHPLGEREGDRTCLECHEPHGSGGPALLKAMTLNESCHECHAETRGPFLFEHAPVREDCTHCHEPHGASFDDLLTRRTPFLCQQCHLAPFHPSTLLDGEGRPPRGGSHLLVGKDCMNCHSRIHGSNHPSGAGLIR